MRRAEQLASTQPAAVEAPPASVSAARTVVAPTLPSQALGLPANDLFARIREIPFAPSRDSHLVDPSRPHQVPAEEFRSLRTRLNHLRSQQPIKSVVVTSPSPAEGKSFAAANLAIVQSQLENNATLLVDCDFRRPVVHNALQIERTPGLTDYLQGKAALEDCIRRVEGSNLYVFPAGEAVVNPLELLNLREMKLLIDQLSSWFNWVILDSPPLLFAADASLLSTLCSGTVLVVRIGATTVDSVTRAMQSLCHNNVLGIVVNGARRGELYSKYTYYHSYGEAAEREQAEEEREVQPVS